MGYRLHATIPNVNYVDNNMEIGKLYDSIWDSVLAKYKFSDEDDKVFVTHTDYDADDLREFVKDIKKANAILEGEESIYTLYNLELLDNMVEFAILHRYTIWFHSY